MSLARCARPLRNIESGQIHTVYGLFAMLFLMILGMTQFQLAACRASSDYLEDALAAGDLAAALIDVREYGSSHKLVIPDPEVAYETYLQALQTNLQLREDGTSAMEGLVSGPVRVLRYEVYNVDEETGEVEIYSLREGGFVRSTGRLGSVEAPNGQKVGSTGIYSEITYPLEGIFGMEIPAHKGKLAEVRRTR